MKLTSLFALSLGAAMLSSCATKFTQAERQQLSTVAVRPAAIAPGAYQKPDGGDQQVRQAAAMGGVGGGAIGGALGALIGEGIASAQHASFERKNGSLFASVEKNAPRDLDRTFSDELTKNLKNDGFFASRVRPQSANQFTSTIRNYHLMRTGKNSNGELLFSPVVTAEVSLQGSSGKPMWKTIAVGQASSSQPIAVYASNPKQSRDAYAQAVQGLMKNVHTALQEKTKN